MRPALACGKWGTALIRIGDTGWWGWCELLCRTGLVRHRGIWSYRGLVSKQGDPVSRWTVIDRYHRIRLGSRRAAQRIRILATRGSRRGTAAISHRRVRARFGASTQREQRERDSHDKGNPSEKRSTDHDFSAGAPRRAG